MTFPQFLEENEALTPVKRVSIIPAPLANTVSWGTGTDKGPAAILEASPALESFDDELLIETYRAGIETLAPLELAGLGSAEACALICRTVGGELARDRLPVVLGGEHTVTLPAVAACLRKYPDLHVVQVDAHLDLRDSYQNDPLSHASVMRRLDDLGVPFTQVGIRSFSKEEWELAEHRGFEPFFMHRLKNEPDWLEQVCARAAGPLYITIDVDGLDPAVMPATGTPEPDGLSWETTTTLLRGLASRSKIIGFDLVELAPRETLHHATFTAAKLLYRTLGYIFEPLLRSTDKGRNL